MKTFKELIDEIGEAIKKALVVRGGKKMKKKISTKAGYKMQRLTMKILVELEYMLFLTKDGTPLD